MSCKPLVALHNEKKSMEDQVSMFTPGRCMRLKSGRSISSPPHYRQYRFRQAETNSDRSTIQDNPGTSSKETMPVQSIPSNSMDYPKKGKTIDRYTNIGVLKKIKKIVLSNGHFENNFSKHRSVMAPLIR